MTRCGVHLGFMQIRAKLFLGYAAFGSALITSTYGVVDMAMVGQYQGPEGTAAMV